MQLRSSVQSHRRAWVPRLRLLQPPELQDSLQAAQRPVAELLLVACARERFYALELAAALLLGSLFLQRRNRNLPRPRLVEAEAVARFFSRGLLAQRPHRRL